jgi:hypothetical protein
MSLPPLKRTLIRDQLETVLKTIAAGVSFHTSLGSSVHVWRPVSDKFEDNEIPGCNLMDLKGNVLNEQSGGSTNRWVKQAAFQLSIVCRDIQTYDKCVADVYAAIEADATLGGLAIDVTSEGDEIDVDEEEQTVIGGKVSLIVMYDTNRMEI